MKPEEVLLVGERDLLATIAAPGDGYPLMPRPVSEEPHDVARRVAQAAPRLALLFGPRPGEVDAIRESGTNAAAWTDSRFPVTDSLFTDTELSPGPLRVFFSGPTSERRDRFLQPVKHLFDVLHVAAGADSNRLRDLMARCTIAIDLAGEPGLPLVDRVGPATAAGMLVLAERPVERTGLTEGADALGFSNPDELELLISDALREPEAFLPMRGSARERAEQWRASACLPNALAELA